MLIQVVNSDGENAILFGVSNNYSLDEATESIQKIIAKANEKVENSDEDLYLLDEVEYMLPSDIHRVYTEMINCDLL